MQWRVMATCFVSSSALLLARIVWSPINGSAFFEITKTLIDKNVSFSGSLREDDLFLPHHCTRVCTSLIHMPTPFVHFQPPSIFYTREWPALKLEVPIFNPDPKWQFYQKINVPERFQNTVVGCSVQFPNLSGMIWRNSVW